MFTDTCVHVSKNVCCDLSQISQKPKGLFVPAHQTNIIRVGQAEQAQHQRETPAPTAPVLSGAKHSSSCAPAQGPEATDTSQGSAFWAAGAQTIARINFVNSNVPGRVKFKFTSTNKTPNYL